ncbi:MAG: hypothetical protein EBU49_12135 [Proteobacteria bacterium]|nr:hypothetical protein [Pseudomonadota bacterium]
MPGTNATELVFQENFHPDTIAALNELREIRLGNLEHMLANLAKTATALGAAGSEVRALQVDASKNQRFIASSNTLTFIQIAQGRQNRPRIGRHRGTERN